MAKRLGLTAAVVGAVMLSAGPVAPVAWAEVTSIEPVGKPADPSSLGAYLAGYHAQLSHDQSAAADFLIRALKDDPDNENLQRRVMWTLVGAGRIAEAVPLADKLAVRDNEAPIAAMLAAFERVNAGDWVGAEKKLTIAPKNNLSKFLLPLTMGWIHAGAGKTDMALATLKAVGDASSNTVLRDLHSGLIAELAGRMDQAEQFYAAAIIAQPRAPLRMVEAIGGFFERHGKKSEAESLYRDYSSENPESLYGQMLVARLAEGKKAPPIVGNAREGLAEAMFHFGSALQQDRSGDLALVLGRLALYLRPDLAVSGMMVAGVLEQQQRFEEANKVYEGIAPSSWLSWSARLRVAANLEALDRLPDSERVLQDLVKERKDRVDALVQLGTLLRTKERFADAVGVYDQAMNRVPKVENRHWTLFYSRGIALERSKQWARAETDFLRALELQPDQPYVLNYLGYSWVDQGINLDRGMQMIRKAVEQRPNDGYIVDSLGWAYYRVNEYEKAVEHLERAVELRPIDPTINDHLGDAYWKVGRTQEARFQWKRAQGLKPEPDLAASIVKKLKEGLSAAAPGQRGG